jgi:hypothetical protein
VFAARIAHPAIASSGGGDLLGQLARVKREFEFRAALRADRKPIHAAAQRRRPQLQQ